MTKNIIPMSRRTILTALPASGVALALPSIAKPISLNGRMDAMAAEITALIRHVAPEGCGSLHVSVGENWNPHEKKGIWWNTSCSFYRLAETLPNGRDFWVIDGIQRMNPYSLTWA